MLRSTSILSTTCLLLLALFFGRKIASAQIDWQSKVDPQLIDTLDKQTQSAQFIVRLTEQADLSTTQTLTDKTNKNREVYETLRDHATQTQAPIIAQLDAMGATYQAFWITNVILVDGDHALVEQLAKRKDVVQIHTNQRMTAPEPIVQHSDAAQRNAEASAIAWGITQTKADQVWDTLNVTGAGVIIAGQDTGYEWQHAALKASYRGWRDDGAVNHNYSWHDAITTLIGHTTPNPCGLNSAEPCDDHGHGTHTMGTMVGSDGTNEQIGMAPDAQWIGCRNMERGAGTLATYIDCFQWFVAPTDLTGNNPDPAQAPHVINNSWGCPASEGCNSSNFATMQAVVSNVKAAGIVVVSSAGNAGAACNTINDPSAIYESSFSVGATDSADNIATFSSRGPVTADGSNRQKPDISAPGVGIRSSVLNNGYASYNGTSMAGPHVAGLVALIISAEPALAGQVAAIENIIRESATPLTTTDGCGGDSTTTVPNHTYGAGRIDALAAVTKAQNSVPTAVAMVNNEAIGVYDENQPLMLIASATAILLGMTLYARQRSVL